MTSGRNAGIALTLRHKSAKKPTDLPKLDTGQVRHPVFGRNGTWVGQTVRPGFFTDAMTEQADTVRKELMAVLDDAVKTVTQHMPR